MIDCFGKTDGLAMTARKESNIMANSVKVVFRSDVRGIAQAGEVKNVSSGYARNFLFPRKLAFAAAEGTLRQWETERQGTLAKASKMRQDTQSIAERIDAITCTIPAKASAEGRLFGSVSRHEIRDMLIKEGITVDRRAIELLEPLKQVGLATVPVHLGHGVTAQLKVNVVAEN
jgi:large subunit ribosomal protein L9